MPKYVRFNTILQSEENINEHLQNTGWNLCVYDPGSISYEQFLNFVKVNIYIFNILFFLSFFLYPTIYFLTDCDGEHNIYLKQNR